MNKPLTLAYEDFKKNLTNTINGSGLPAFVVELVLRDFVNEVKIIANNQYASDMAEFAQQVATAPEDDPATKIAET